MRLNKASWYKMRPVYFANRISFTCSESTHKKSFNGVCSVLFDVRKKKLGDLRNLCHQKVSKERKKNERKKRDKERKREREEKIPQPIALPFNGD